LKNYPHKFKEFRNIFEKFFFSKITKQERTNKERILFANNIPAYSISTELDYSLAQEIQRRGYKVALSFCDGALEACQNCKFSQFDSPEELVTGEWKKNPFNCSRCEIKRQNLSDNLIHQILFSDYEVEAEVKDLQLKIEGLSDESLKKFTIDGINIYEHAFAGVSRFYAKGSPYDEGTFSKVLRKYLTAACRTLIVYKKIFQDFSPSVVVCHHGIYVPQGIVVDLAKKLGIRVVSYNTGYRDGTFVFAHDDTYHKILPHEKIPKMKFSTSKEKIITEYLLSRRSGKNDWIYYNNSSAEEINIRAKYAISDNHQIVSVFSNVYWDAQLHFPENIYPNMMIWLKQTILILSELKNIHCIVRAHPGEVTGFVPSRQLAIDELIKEMEIPSNITLVRSDDATDSYQIAEQSDLVIVYATKMAGELSALGKKVIVCGDAFAKGKGFTYDPDSDLNYRSLVKKLLDEGPELDEERKLKAMMYCYDFFFKRSVPIEFANQNKATNKVSIPYPGVDVIRDNINDYPGLKTICDGIINGDDFRVIDSE
jgi:hypothetical protein